jgi:hypothetical protein
MVKTTTAIYWKIEVAPLPGWNDYPDPSFSEAPTPKALYTICLI